MDRAVSSWLQQHHLPQHAAIPLQKKLQKSYTIYGCMILFPPTAWTGPEWQPVRPALDHDPDLLEHLYASICTHLKVTHIALNKPIPLHLHPTTTSSPPPETPPTAPNILRSPTAFHPLHGSFGPPTSSSPPTATDFTHAFWTTTTQNRIHQTWAPRWTMFSRGNISEKARLLALPSVRRAAATAPAGCAAVDLYVGVGYFAFSYLAAGVREVLGWDLNPWSVEGCRRGAERNRWAVEVFGRSRGEGEEDLVDRDVAAYLARVRGEDDDGATPARLLVFNEDNARAPQRVALLRRARRDSATPLPPVRHVNCGMLPSSRAALRLAAEVLDRGWTCWVHVHENFLVEEVAVKAEETRRELEEIVGELWGCGEGGKPTTVEVEYVNRLKSYAPGVVHCVIDLVVGPGLGE